MQILINLGIPIRLFTCATGDHTLYKGAGTRFGLLDEKFRRIMIMLRIAQLGN